MSSVAVTVYQVQQLYRVTGRLLLLKRKREPSEIISLRNTGDNRRKKERLTASDDRRLNSEQAKAGNRWRGDGRCAPDECSVRLVDNALCRYGVMRTTQYCKVQLQQYINSTVEDSETRTVQPR
ncbi:hypothetical protein ACI65C_007743 [Semiaphis heraclei]